MKINLRTTAQVAKELGIPPSTLASMIDRNKIRPPAWRFAGAYAWTAKDIKEAARAREAMRAYRRRGAQDEDAAT